MPADANRIVSIGLRMTAQTSQAVDQIKALQDAFLNLQKMGEEMALGLAKSFTPLADAITAIADALNGVDFKSEEMGATLRKSASAARTFAKSASTVSTAWEQATSAILTDVGDINGALGRLGTADNVRRAIGGVGAMGSMTTTETGVSPLLFGPDGKPLLLPDNVNQASQTLSAGGNPIAEPAAVEQAVAHEMPSTSGSSQESSGGHGSGGILHSKANEWDFLVGGMMMYGTARSMATYMGAAIGQFQQYDQAMRMVRTESDLTNKQYQAMYNSILQLSSQYPVSATDAANAMYKIYAAGFHGATGMAILREAAKGAVAGNMSIMDSTNSLITVMDAYGMHVTSAAQATQVAEGVLSMMHKTTVKGVISFQDLATNINKVTSIAHAMGVPLKDVLASFSIMSNKGVDAAQSATRIVQLIQHLSKFSKASTTAIGAQNVAAIENALHTQGLGAALQVLERVTGGNAALIQQAIPDVRAFDGAVMLMGTHFQQVANSIQAAKSGGSQDFLQKAYNINSRSLNMQLQQLHTSLQSIGIQFGQAILPALTLVIEKLGQFLNWLNHLSPATKKWIMYVTAVSVALMGVMGVLTLVVGQFIIFGKTMGVLLSPALKLYEWVIKIDGKVALLGMRIRSYLNPALEKLGAGFKTAGAAVLDFGKRALVVAIQSARQMITYMVEMASAAYAQAAAFVAAYWPIMAIVAALAAVGVAVYEVIAHWTAFKTWVVNMFNDIWRFIQKWGVDILDIIVNPFGAAVPLIIQHFGQIKAFFMDLGSEALQWGENMIGNLIKGIEQTPIARAVTGVAKTIKNFLGFHSPTKEGPGAEADTWAPNFVKMYAQGLIKGLPEIQKASAQLAGALPPTTAHSNAVIGQGAARTGGVNITINLSGNVTDEKKLAEKLKTVLAKELRVYGVG